MKLDNLHQPPFNVTLMGVLRGALDYYEFPFTSPFVYGASGHAFLLNIHPELCPSSPYCWNHAPMFVLIGNLGIRINGLGFYHNQSSQQEREVLESRVRKYLDNGTPCYLLNMENQLITGYDDTGFLTAQPWSCTDFPQAHLTFGSWEEFGGEVHVTFNALERSIPMVQKESIIASLRYAVNLHRNPAKHTSEPYGVCPNGYANWSRAIRNGQSGGHGGWWNGMVWSECRALAADYFREIAQSIQSVSEANAIADDYSIISQNLMQCADMELDSELKLSLLEDSAQREEHCIQSIENLIEELE